MNILNVLNPVYGLCNYYDMVSYFVTWRYLFRNCNKRFHNNNKNGLKNFFERCSFSYLKCLNERTLNEECYVKETS